MPDVRVTMFDTGYCTTKAELVALGTGWTPMRCYAPAFLLEHPTAGPCLFDTGYAPRILDAFARWPARLYAFATPTVPGVPVVEQLAARGIAARDVRTVIVSHLHADHVAGLCDFPSACFVISAGARALYRETGGLAAVQRGVVLSLFPRDFVARCQVIDRYLSDAAGPLGPTCDLFGDGSVRLVPLPGHARGQIGALVTSHRGPLLLCADGAWTSRSYREQRMPHPVTAAMQDDMQALGQTLLQLRTFAEQHPEVTILPTHCSETLAWGAAG